MLQWLYWQMAGLDPMAGQNHHFAHYAPEQIPAGYLIVVGNDPDRGRLAGNFSRLCAAANLRKVRVMLEFIPYSHIHSLAQAVALLVDVKPANAGVLVDALHLSRSGGSPADLANMIRCCSPTCTCVMRQLSPGTRRSPSRLRAPVGLNCPPRNAQAWLRPGQGSCSGS